MHERPAQTPQARWLLTGVGLAIGGTFLFALKSIFIKLAFAAGAGATQLLTLRMLLALPFYIAVWCYLSQQSPSSKITPSTMIRALLLGFLGYYLASYLDLQGLVYISAQLERLTLFTYPAMVAVLAWMFLGEALGWRVITAIALCYCGLAIMYWQEATASLDNKTTTGVLLVMGSAISYSCYILFAKPTMQRIGSQRFTSLAMIGSTVFVCIHFAATQPLVSLYSAKPVVYVYGLILALVCTVIPSYMISEAIVRIGATRTTVIGSIGPVLTMLLAIAVLSEPSSWQHFAGMAVAISGVSLVSRR